MTFADNRRELNALVDRFKYWLHVEDPTTLYTICAAILSHQIPGDPVWLMIIGPSSDGKSELLRAFTQQGDVTIDDLTEHTFVSGYKNAATDDIPQFAELLANRIWFIYDLSIMMSKPFEERSTIFSDMRMIYDGRLKKRFGNKAEFDIPTPNNTLVCGSTPIIDRTILEDQLMGTRFITWRTKTGNRKSIMDKIDATENDFMAMRNSLKAQVNLWKTNTKIEEYTFTPQDNERLQAMANHTTLLRTSVDTDRLRELANEAYPEAPGRFYRQLKKMYRAYRIIGLDEVEAMQCCQKMCMDCIIPTRIRILEWLFNNNHNGGKHSLSEVSVGCQMGKGACKTHLSALMGLSIIRFDEVYNEHYRRDIEQWSITDGNWGIFFRKPQQIKLDSVSAWEKVDPVDGLCAFCGLPMARMWKYEGNYYCEACHRDWSQ